MTVLLSPSHTHVFVVLVVLLTSLLASTVSAQEYTCPKECNCYIRVPGFPEDMIVHQCTISSFNSYQNFSIIDTDIPSGLMVDCLFPNAGSKLRDNIFSGLRSFVFVHIRNCDFSFLPRHTFAGMPKLRHIRIHGAKFLQLHPEVFVDIPSLETLSIVESGVKNIPNLCNLQNLTSLNLTGNHISQFQDVGVNCTARPVLQKLVIIDLTENEISHVPGFVSKSVPNLVQLSIANNILGQGEKSHFCDSLNLAWLDLNNNSFIEFPVDLFANCYNLELLGLSHNGVRDIPNGLLSPVRGLRLLEFHHTAVGDEIWLESSHLTELRTLRLDHNNIHGLGDLPHALENLITLNLTGNSISSLNPNIFSKMKTLTQLYLSHNRLRRIDDNVFVGLKNLTSLDLRENFIEYISSSSFYYLDSLQVVNLSYNSLEQLPDLRHAPQLFVVDARNNKIENINESLCEGNSLTGINLMRNQIDHIGSKMFRRCYKLQFVHLSYNKISTIEFGSFKDAVINVLLLRYNQLGDITNLMTSMKHLIEVDLSHNDIKGGIYSDLFPSSIQNLDLSFNLISHIAYQTFVHMHGLRIVDLKMNRITSFNSFDIAVSRRLVVQPVFRMSGNPLKCDCNLHWLKRRSESTMIIPGMPSFDDVLTTLCVWTFRGEKVMLYQLPIDEFLCEYRERCLITCICCDFIHCDCRQTCPEPCNCYNSQDWTSNHFVMCSNNGLDNIPQSLPNLATKIFLDGNNLSSVGNHAIIGMSHLKEVYLNHSKIVMLEPRAFVDLKELETLHLDHNNIKHLQSGIFDGVDHLSILHLEYNDIFEIENGTFESLPSLTVLYLDHNALVVLSDNVIANFMSLSTLTLSGNPWSCQCDFVTSFGELLFQASDLNYIECVYDAADIYSGLSGVGQSLNEQYRSCLNITRTVNATLLEVKEKENKTTVYSLTIVCVFVVLAVTVAGLVAWHRELLKIWIFTKFGVKILSAKLDDSGRPFDAFVSYSSKDENFVLHEIIPHLEHGIPKFKLCLHFRDFQIGEPIGDNIVNSIEASKRTILLLSNDFLSSEWCQFEFQTAHHHMLKERSNRLIVVLLKELDEKKVETDPQLKLYLKTRTYLKYDDPWFWQKLKFALPSVRDTSPKPKVQRRSYVLPSPTSPYAVVSVVDSVYEEPISLKSMTNDCSQSSPDPKESDNMEVVSVNTLDSMNIYEEIYPV